MTDLFNQSQRLNGTHSAWGFGLLFALMLVVGCPAPQEPSPEMPPEEHADRTTPPDEVAPVPEQEAPEDVAPGHVRARTLYTDGGAEAERGLYRVHTPDGDAVRSATRSSSFDLPPGRYEISVTVGSATAAEMVEVLSEERTEVDLMLDAGVLALTTYLVENGDPAPNPLYRVLSTETDIQGRRETIVSPTRSSTFTLPVGSYLVKVSEGNATVEREISITAGGRHEVDIILNAGLLIGEAFEENGTEVDRVLWSVLAAEKDITGRRETVATPTRGGRFMLPEGDYVLRVTVGDRTDDQPVTVVAGERTEARIVMPTPE